MSAGSKKAKKELYGHPAVLGHDVISVGASLSGTVTQAAMTNGVFAGLPLQGGCSRFVLPRAAVLDFVCANISPVVTSGVVGVELMKNGTSVFSGVLSTSNTARVENFFHPDTNNAVALASGDALQIFCTVSTALGAVGVQSVHGLNARVGLTYRDAQ
jgi:hypothetical protein